MRIKATGLVLLAVLLLAACSDGTTPTEKERAGDSAAAMATAHFPTFELSVPADWTARGNVGKVYEGASCFLLAGPVEETNAEESIAKNLELFFNTEYYRSQVGFRYDRFETVGTAMTRVEGALQNGRTGDTLRFSGGYCTAPDAYFLYFWSPDSASPGTALAEATYESFHAL